jgi:hypothetical protein
MTRDTTHFARLCMLTAGILIAVQALVSARPTRIYVTGISTIEATVDGEIVPDAADNLHIKQLVQTGDFKLVERSGGNFAIQGTQVLVLNGVLDDTQSGPIAGRFTVKADVDGAVIWEGSVHGVLEGLHFTGEIKAHGRGPYAGLILTLHIEEGAPMEDAEVFELTGSILDPHGS